LVESEDAMVVVVVGDERMREVGWTDWAAGGGRAKMGECEGGGAEEARRWIGSVVEEKRRVWMGLRGKTR
jgi:hypothetical protein